jgi:hypothetical protein
LLDEDLKYDLYYSLTLNEEDNNTGFGFWFFDLQFYTARDAYEISRKWGSKM